MRSYATLYDLPRIETNILARLDPSLGVVPWFDEAWCLPPEDVQDLASFRRAGGLHVAVPHLGLISNFGIPRFKIYLPGSRF